jgi:predicted DsbA family dithiol-disulfide isomerase
MAADLARGTFRDAVARDRAHQAAMAIEALPSTLVHDRRVHGALPVDAYADAVERVLGDRRRSSPGR